jgi:hypothetical protein
MEQEDYNTTEPMNNGSKQTNIIAQEYLWQWIYYTYYCERF